MISINEIKKTLEEKLLEKGRPLSAVEKMQKMFGVTESHALAEDENGRLTDMTYARHIDPQAARDLDNITPSQIGRDWVGSSFQREATDAVRTGTFWNNVERHSKAKGAVESDMGSPITASLMSPINTWGAFTLGLFDFKVLQGYEAAPRVFQEIMPTVPKLIYGGQKHILSGYDGSMPGTALVEGQVAPTVGRKPIWVWSQQAKEFQLQYAITMEALFSDISGTLQTQGTDLGMAQAKNENYRAAQIFFGTVNNYCLDTENNLSPSCNTYQKSTNSVSTPTTPTLSPPFDYINLYETYGLDGVTSNQINGTLGSIKTLNNAYLAMLQSRDPIRGWRMDLGKDFILLANPFNQMFVAQLLKTIQAYHFDGSLAAGTNMTTSENPLVLDGLNFELKSCGMEWFDVLAATAGVGAPTTGLDYQGNVTSTYYTATTAAGNLANAQSSWALISKKHRFAQYEPVIPLRTSTYVLTGDDLSKRIGMRGDALIVSNFVVLEPRAVQLNIAGSAS